MFNRVYAKVSVAVFISFLVLAGCATDPGDTGVRQQGIQQQNNQRMPQGQVQQQRQARQNGTVDNRIQVADRAAQKITNLEGVRRANVLVTRRNAYVAAVLDNNRGVLSNKMETEIAKKVRETDPDIRDVFVSTNPDFVQRINTYVNDVQQGRPISGFFEEFTEMIRRLFPNAR